MFTLKKFCGSSLTPNDYYSSWKIFVCLIFAVWLIRKNILTVNNTRTTVVFDLCISKKKERKNERKKEEEEQNLNFHIWFTLLWEGLMELWHYILRKNS